MKPFFAHRPRKCKRASQDLLSEEQPLPLNIACRLAEKTSNHYDTAGSVRSPAYEAWRFVFSFLDKIVRGSGTKPGEAQQLNYVLGLKFTVHSRAEQDELSVVEDAIRDAGIDGVALDKVEIGVGEVAFWVHAANAKRAFKALSELSPIAERLPRLQAAYADRSVLKFSILWPKGGAAPAPHGLG